MCWRTHRLITIVIVLFTALTFNVRAQQAALVDGKPALRFEFVYAGTPPSHIFVEKVSKNGRPAFRFPISQFHVYIPDACGGNLVVFEDHAIFQPTERVNFYTGVTQSDPSCRADGFDVRCSELGCPIKAGADEVQLNLSGKILWILPLWDPVVRWHTSYRIRTSGLNKPVLEFLALALNDFPAAEREFQRLTEPSAAKLLVSSDQQNAQVYINGELKGTVTQDGLAMALPAGVYQVRVVLPGYKDFTHPVTLVAGDNKEIIAQLERAGPPPFTVADVTELLQGGVSVKRVAALVQQRGVSFALDDDTERKIRDAGGDTDLLLAIAKAKK